MAKVKEKPTIEMENEEAVFLGAEGIRPNRLHFLSPEEGAGLQKELDAQGCGLNLTLQQAFEMRKQNRERTQPNGSSATMPPSNISAMMDNLLRRVSTWEAAQKWLERPNISFGNRSPLDLLREGKTDIVVQHLQAVAEGRFS